MDNKNDLSSSDAELNKLTEEFKKNGVFKVLRKIAGDAEKPIAAVFEDLYPSGGNHDNSLEDVKRIKLEDAIRNRKDNWSNESLFKFLTEDKVIGGLECFKRIKLEDAIRNRKDNCSNEFLFKCLDEDPVLRRIAKNDIALFKRQAGLASDFISSSNRNKLIGSDTQTQTKPKPA